MKRDFINRTLNLLYNYIFIYTRLKKHGRNIRINRKSYYINGLKYITIGNDFTCSLGLWLEAIDSYEIYKYNPNLNIGNHVSIERNCHIGCIHKIVIGDNVLIGSNVLIEDHSHGKTFDYSKFRRKLELVSNGDISIGNNVWICDNVVILAGAKIGNNCVIAANSVVNKEFPDNCLIGGVPAKIMKKINC